MAIAQADGFTIGRADTRSMRQSPARRTGLMTVLLRRIAFVIKR